jgi:V/A-type H+-transporting ATPase subunit I
VGAAVPGVGFLLSIVIVFVGHTLNLVLALASGVIHGLRLNFIEFFNWSMPEEGRPFRAFTKKEASIRTPG